MSQGQIVHRKSQSVRSSKTFRPFRFLRLLDKLSHLHVIFQSRRTLDATRNVYPPRLYCANRIRNVLRGQPARKQNRKLASDIGSEIPIRTRPCAAESFRVEGVDDKGGGVPVDRCTICVK